MEGNHIALQLGTENVMDGGENMDAVENRFEHGVENAVEGQTGTFSFEMLMPEIRMHTLSYMDCPSLCSLSMTNSLMNREVNEEMVWKTLYLKDYTLELHNFAFEPERGWKSLYATNWAAEKTNTEFFKCLKEKSLPAMSKIWLDTDYVQCFSATGESYSGHNEVMESWKVAFSRENVPDFQIQSVKTRVHSRVSWVTVKAHFGTEPCIITNVYELNNGRWYMVLHHMHIIASPIPAEAGEQPLENNMQLIEEGS